MELQIDPGKMSPSLPEGLKIVQTPDGSLLVKVVHLEFGQYTPEALHGALSTTKFLPTIAGGNSAATENILFEKQIDSPRLIP